ncbi:MAG: RNA degradosome polyphosphate kinase, partial [Cyanobacteria bacterium J06636_27]
CLNLRQQVEAKVSTKSFDGRTPQQQLEEISFMLRPVVVQQHQHFEKKLRPELASHGIHILNYIDLTDKQRKFLDNYFEEQVFPVITPLAVDPSHPFPYISNLSLNLAVVVKNPETEEELFARIKVPKVLPRFLPLPPELGIEKNGKSCVWSGVPIEQAIAHNLECLFPGMNIQEYYTFRITRDADLALEEDEADDLLLAIEQELRKRRAGGNPVRIELQSQTPDAVRTRLLEVLDLSENDVYEIDGLLGLRDLMYFMSLPIPELKDTPWKPVVPASLQRIKESTLNPNMQSIEEGKDFFSAIREGDLLVHHPYESFSASVVRFITTAARDPDVLAIKMTLYRTSGDSPIVNALINAAENGKQVSV